MVPNGWQIKRIEQIADVKGGKRIPKGYSLQLEDNGFPYIRVKDMSENGVDTLSILYVPTEIVESISKYTISANDVFITVAGALLGLVGKIPPALENANLTENADKLTNLKINQDYLIAVLRSPIGKKLIEAEKTTNAQPKLALTRIRNFEIPVPPLPEQQKIAKILSTWDKAISTTERLIDNSTEQKKALMQQLLTGKKRLLDESGKRFEGEWEVAPLKDCVTFLNGMRKPIKQEDRADIQGQYPYFGATGIIDYVNDYIFDDELILLGEDGENILSRAVPHVFMVSGKIWVNNHAHVMKANKDKNSEFLCIYLESLDYKKFNSGSAQPKINKAVCEKIPVYFPSLNEQNKIAIVLTNADKEIELLEQQLADLQQEKKALMQVLLTGKKRVVVDG
ncbi:restriction endonuclease subunit S [uncultured Psychrobacter sp.]|uniref:restriction endonuclease subunit S n=1 Tax=uncultured Psychrobacter sp. TaxID=259303 RepID=UPI003458B438